VRLRLRLTGEGLRLTGAPPGWVPPSPPPPPARALLVTENGDLLVTDAGERLQVETSHGQ
jgi:hypothetical protein